MALPKIDTTKIDEIHRELGRLLVHWNKVEIMLVQLLIAATGLDRRTLEIITAEMTSEARISTLQACLSEMSETDEVIRLKWACNYADRLREWRNFFVHRVTGTFVSGATDMSLQAFSLRARGKVVADSFRIQASDIRRIADHCSILSSFAVQMCAFMQEQEKPATSEVARPMALPEMPPLPEKWDDYKKAQRASQSPP